MTFEDYQFLTDRTAIYPNKGELIGLCYVALGLSEVGEIQGKVKKIIRDDNGVVSEEKKSAISKEIGDSLWYISQIATELGLSLSDIAQENIDKLAKRKAAGTLGGSGDNR